jgi:hypothetical protein
MSEKDIKNFTDVDFDGIKASLKEFMKTQDNLQDYDFEGSIVNTMLDVLAYNTQYNAFYANMLASERFIATAQRRSSLIQIARTLGYVPISRRPSVGYVDLVLTPTVGYAGLVTIPSNTIFTSTINSVTYKYITREDISLSQVGGVYTASDVAIYEGKRLVHTYTVSEAGLSLTIPNVGVDTTNIKVTVFSGVSDSVGVQFTQVNDFTQVKATDTNFFIDEVDGEKHKVYFGNDIIGKKVVVGSIVQVTYYTSNGSDSNGARLYTLSTAIPNVASTVISSEVKAMGGSPIEATDSIRDSAPLFFQRQNRAVTDEDFRSIIKELYPNAKSVTAWGGETESPPKYGFAFVSVLTDSNGTLSEQTKNVLRLQLRQRYATLTTFPELVDPQFIYLTSKTLVSYDGNMTNAGSSNIIATVTDVIKDYSAVTLNQFKSVLRYSKLIANIDNSVSSIVSNQTEIEMYIKYSLNDTLKQNLSFNFYQEIDVGSVRSNTFDYGTFASAFFLENADGFADLVYTSPSTQLTINIIKDALKINYITGSITFNTDEFDFDKISISELKPLQMFALPDKFDITSYGRNVIIFNDSDIQVEAIDVRTGLQTGVIKFIK